MIWLAPYVNSDYGSGVNRVKIGSSDHAFSPGGYTH
jgi:hypothetical protein